MFTKSLLAIAAVAVVGVVGYKIIKKKNPEFLNKIKEGTNNFFEGASEAFKEGYASASPSTVAA